MKLEPIVISLLDTDLYKFNMDQVIFHKHTDLCGQYYFKCRNEGVVFTPEMMQEIVSDPFADVTFSGGDPLYQAEALLPLLKRIKAETSKTVWVYTGFTYEHLPEAAQPLLDYIDVLVDGPFVQALRDEDLLFRGSSNQRLVDIRLSREAGSVVEWSRDF